MNSRQVSGKHAELNPTDLVDWRPIAAKLKVKERAFWRIVHEGGLPVYRINSRVLRFKIADVDQWLSARRTGGVL